MRIQKRSDDGIDVTFRNA